MRECHSQDEWTIRVEWGPVGAEGLTSYAVERGPVVAAVVDVLSFTTCVSVAMDAGMAVWPYRWKDDSAQDLAERQGAVLAVDRVRAAEDGGVSLSPQSIRDAAGSVDRLVLPSPNGSTISALLEQAGAAAVAAASLRNRRAVGEWVVERLDALASDAARSGAIGRPAVVVVPAGEGWPDGSLRPAVEDLWGAGAVIEAVATQLEHRAGPMLLSPEAQVALGAWLGIEGRVADSLAACSSGRELIEMGYWSDVTIASEVDASQVAPVLSEGAFRPARPASPPPRRGTP